VRAVLFIAAYQIIWMDRIPVFAAVDRAVNLARRLVGGKAHAMVNAVLRRLTDSIAERRAHWPGHDAAHLRVSWHDTCRFKCPVLPPVEVESLATHVAAATGERRARYEQLVRRHGAEAAESIAWASQTVPATVLQRNSLRCTPDEFQTALQAAHGNNVTFAGDAAYLPAATPVISSSAFRDGLVFVQDRTACAAALAVGAQAGERVLDLCAAPGGKSAVMAMRMGNVGELVACDTADKRLALVRDNSTRLGLSCIRTRLVESAADNPLDEPPFDAALVDVPCSNTGVIARRPEARLGLTNAKVRSLVELQGKLLRKAAAAVRPGGRLVYSTCSIEPEENDEVVAAFLDSEPRWRLDTAITTLPTWGPHPSDWCDGGYAARLVSSPDAS